MQSLKSLSLSAFLLLSTHAPSPAWAGFATFEEVRRSFQSTETRFLDRHGEQIHSLRRDDRSRRVRWIPLEGFSRGLTRAVVRAEDQRFWSHSGVDWLAVARAAWDSGLGLRSQVRRGASTLTMQLVTLLETGGRPRARRGALSKASQMVSALRLERAWKKEEILEAYLNLASFRGELIGAETASQALFGKSADSLSISEAAILAVLLRAPTADIPIVKSRALRLLESLNESPNSVDWNEQLARLRVPLRIVPEQEWSPHAARRIAIGSRTEIRTTLDRTLQREVTEILREQAGLLKQRGASDAAALVVENATGQVWAYVGGLGPSSSGVWVDAVQARRQAGSVLKPFLYGMAIERRLLTAGSTLDDSPAEFLTAGGMYRPRNFDQQFHGSVRAAEALASSLNVPAVRVLDHLGIEPAVVGLRELGLESLESAEFYGHSLALGSADVPLWELVTAYATLARGGKRIPSHLEAQESPNAVHAVQSRALGPGAASIVAHILSEPSYRALSFGLTSPLSLSGWAAAKTGTSKDMRDNWCLGFNSRFTVGVWVGNYSGQPMKDVSGVSGAAPAWARIMTSLQRRFPSRKPALLPEVVLAEGMPYLRGTEPARGHETVSAPPMARITYPTDGELIAHDPDIPEAHQRLPIDWEGPDGLRLELDGTEIQEKFIRLPNLGKHRLVLRDPTDGRTLDQVNIEVR